MGKVDSLKKREVNGPTLAEVEVSLEAYLDLCTFVADHSWYSSEGGELIRSNFWVDASQVTEQSGLAYWGEPHKPNTGISSFCHIETYSTNGAQYNYENIKSQGCFKCAPD